MQIGEKIKRLRIEKQLTQQELANRCELSKGFISQLENDLTSPSIATLVDILQILGTNLKEFFNDQDNHRVTFSKEDMFETEDEEVGYKLMWLIPDAQKNDMEPIYVELQKGAKTGEIEPHEGEEFGYVLAGKVQLHYGDQVYSLKKGQTFYIKGDKNHFLTNEDQTVAKVIWVSTPPSF